MTSRETTALAIKFLALWLTVNLVLYLPSLIASLTVFSAFAGEASMNGAVVVGIGAFVLLGVTSCLILFRMSNSILRTTMDTDALDSASVSQSFLLQLLGAYFAVSALQSITRFAFVYLSTPADLQSLSNLMQISSYLFEFLVGLLLIVKPKVWAHWLAVLRGRARLSSTKSSHAEPD